MHTTSNLKLKKPEGTDVVNIEDINSNMDKLDVEVAKKASHSIDGRMSKEDKTKLDGIASGANKYIHPSTHSLDMISETSSKKVMTSTERSKLSGIASGANKYVHPSKHSAGVITQDSSHRFVTDSEKSSWSSKVDGKHTHDDRYYTESEVNSKLSKIDTSITHIKNDVSSNKSKISDSAYKSAGGSTNSISVSKTGFVLSTGHFVDFKARYTNSGNVNLSVNSYSYKDLKNADGTELSAGDIEANNYYRAIWNGSFFVLASKGGTKMNFDIDQIKQFETTQRISKGDLVSIVEGKVSKGLNYNLFSDKAYTLTSSIVRDVDATMLTDNKILVCYFEDQYQNVNDAGKCCILTINDDDTISMGNISEFVGDVHINNLSVAKFTENSAVVCYRDSRNSSRGQACFLNIDLHNNTVVRDTIRTFEHNNVSKAVAVTELTSTKVALVYCANKEEYSDRADVKAQIIERSSNGDITMHTQTKLDYNAWEHLDAITLSSNRIALCYSLDREDEDDHTYGYIQTFCVNNNILTCDDSFQFVRDNYTDISIAKLSDTKLALLYNSFDRRDCDNHEVHFMFITVDSSGNLTSGSDHTLEYNAQSSLSVIRLDNSHAVVFYNNSMRVIGGKIGIIKNIDSTGITTHNKKALQLSNNRILLFEGDQTFRFIYNTKLADGFALETKSSYKDIKIALL